MWSYVSLFMYCGVTHTHALHKLNTERDTERDDHM